MPRDALTTRTGLILGAASLMLAASAFGLTIRGQPKIAPAPDYICRLPAAEWRQPPAPDPVVIIAEPDPLAQLPAECIRYITGIRRLAQANCNSLNAGGRQSLLEAADLMVKSWQSVPEGAIKPLTDACRQGDEAIQKATVQLCPQ